MLNPFECFRVWIPLRCPAKANIRLESSTMNAWLSSCAPAEGARFQINILLNIVAFMLSTSGIVTTTAEIVLNNSNSKLKCISLMAIHKFSLETRTD